jgi:hypothetical protein
MILPDFHGSLVSSQFRIEGAPNLSKDEEGKPISDLAIYICGIILSQHLNFSLKMVDSHI